MGFLQRPCFPEVGLLSLCSEPWIPSPSPVDVNKQDWLGGRMSNDGQHKVFTYGIPYESHDSCCTVLGIQVIKILRCD